MCTLTPMLEIHQKRVTPALQFDTAKRKMKIDENQFRLAYYSEDSNYAAAQDSTRCLVHTCSAHAMD